MQKEFSATGRRLGEAPESGWFCPFCFASDQGGSWDGTVDEANCTNCGMSGGVKLPRWAMDRIRQSATWVGKRYYPDEEDRENREELCRLRALMPIDPRIVVEPGETPGYWHATRMGPRGLSEGVSFAAGGEADAMGRARELMRYRPRGA